MPIGITAEQRALQAAVRDWAKSADPIALVRQLEPGTPPAAVPDGPDGQYDRAPWPGATPTYVAGAAGCWAGLTELGVFSIALPAAVGGADGTVADLAAALEQVTAALLPGPVMPTLLAGLLLAADPAQPAAAALLPGLAAGQASVAVALSAGTLHGAWQDDGTLRVTGETGPVLGAGSTTHLLLGATVPTTAAGGPAARPGATVPAAAVPAAQPGAAVAAAAGARTSAADAVWFLVPAGHPGLTLLPRPPVDFSRTLAGVRLDAAVIDPAQLSAGLGTPRVRDLAATLAAVEAAAVAAWCCDTAAQYARTRHQFGRAIGSFQAVKHLCAGMLCRADRATALAWDAARTADEAPDEHPLAAAAAAALALDAAVDNAKDCIQVLGGIGFTWEHDAHLYLRRALALRQLLGGSAAWRRRVAGLALAGARRRLGVHLAGQPTPSGAAAVREVAAAVAALPAEQRRAALADAGYVAPQWPAPYGQSASLATQLVIDEELNRAGLIRPDLVIGGWAGYAILQHGTPAQRDRFVWPTLRGEIAWCQLFSEPEAGSDLAGVRTRAERERVPGEGLAADRAESLDLTGPPGGLGDLPGPHRPHRGQAPRAQLLPGRHDQPGHRHPAAARDDRPRHVQRGVPG